MTFARNDPAIQFALPFPVPLHACFVKSKGGSGIPSKRYKAYAAEATAMLYQQGRPRMSGPVDIKFSLTAPDRRKRDGDNLFKCLMDTLVNNGVIEDDNNAVARSIALSWRGEGVPCLCTIRPEGIG